MLANMLRKALVALHRWLGLMAGVFLLILGLTGCLLVFADEIDAALNPKLFRVTPQQQRRSLEEIARAAERTSAGQGVMAIRVANAPDRAFQVSMRSGRVVFVDPYTARVLGARRREQVEVFYIHSLHTQLLADFAGPQWVELEGWAHWFLGGVSFVACLMVLTGLLLWLRYRLLGVRWREGGPAIVFDLHNIGGFYASLVLLVIAATGTAIAFEGRAYSAIERRMGDPPRPRVPQATGEGDRQVSFDQAVSAAQKALPDALVALVMAPQGTRGVYRVQLKYPEDRTPTGRSRVYVDPHTGKLLLVEDFRTAPAGMQITNRIRALHTGDIFGWPTRILWSAAALVLVIQVVTGVAVWVRRRRAEVIGMPRGYICEEQPPVQDKPQER